LPVACPSGQAGVAITLSSDCMAPGEASEHKFVSNDNFTTMPLTIFNGSKTKSID